MRRRPLDRRRLLLGAAGFLGSTALAGCDRFASTPSGERTLGVGEDANLYVQRLLLTPRQLAPEYAEADISPWFKPNGTEDPPDRAYKVLAKAGFRTFRLEIGGLVDRPMKLSLDELRRMPSRTQITRHDCVEGWTCVGKWTGVPLGVLLQETGLKPNARYVVFHCADTMEGGEADQQDDDQDQDQGSGTDDAQSGKKGQSGQSSSGGAKGQTSGGGDDDQDASDKGSDDKPAPPVRYYETIDLNDAFHPQTILAYDMNGQTLPVAHGAPLRLRIERQLGYKMAKYVMRIEVVESYAQIGQGHGGYWEDNGYEWYAGI